MKPILYRVFYETVAPSRCSIEADVKVLYCSKSGSADRGDPGNKMTLGTNDIAELEMNEFLRSREKICHC